MWTWLTEDFLKAILPRAVAALVAIGIAHSQTLQNWGLTLDWTKIQGKLDALVVLLIGLAAAHHTEKVVKGA